MSENTIEATPENKIPDLSLIKRNEWGLYDNVDYVFAEDGSVNWRKMVKPEYLVNNKQKTSETDVSKLKDSEMLILLGGIKHLAAIRGFYSVTFKVHAASLEYCCVSCKINWIGNYETGGKDIEFESIADAHHSNTEGFGGRYLASIAENRAFIRCVRNFLKINIVGKEELQDAGLATEEKDSSSDDASPSPVKMLSELMLKKNVSLEKVKSRLIKDGVVEAEDYKSVNDIPSSKIFELIELIKKKP